MIKLRFMAFCFGTMQSNRYGPMQVPALSLMKLAPTASNNSYKQSWGLEVFPSWLALFTTSFAFQASDSYIGRILSRYSAVHCAFARIDSANLYSGLATASSTFCLYSASSHNFLENSARALSCSLVSLPFWHGYVTTVVSFMGNGRSPCSALCHRL